MRLWAPWSKHSNSALICDVFLMSNISECLFCFLCSCFRLGKQLLAAGGHKSGQPTSFMPQLQPPWLTFWLMPCARGKRYLYAGVRRWPGHPHRTHTLSPCLQGHQTCCDAACSKFFTAPNALI